MATTRSTPTESPSSSPPVEVLIDTVHEADEGSIASAPTPSTVDQGLGARFRTTKPTPKKVVFDAMNWLANKIATATATAAAAATNATSHASSSSYSNQQDNYNRTSHPDEQGKGSEVDGSDSASGRKAPGHANTSAPDASHAHHNGLPATDQLLTLMALMNQVNPKRNPIIPPTPRVGGVDSIGAWTGHGAGTEGLSPRTTNCRKKNSISINVYPLHPQKKVVGATPPHLQVVVVDHFLPIARQGWDWQSRLR